MVYQANSHIVFTVIPAYGHIRSICIFVARLVKENEDIFVTVLVPPNHLEKSLLEVQVELGSALSEGSITKRIRVLSTFKLACTSPATLTNLMKPTGDTFATAYETLLEEKPLKCAVNETVFEAVRSPTMVIVDFFAVEQFLAIRRLSGDRVPIVAAITAHASSILRLFGPESYGGIGNLSEKMKAEAARRGISVDDLGDEIYSESSGKVIRIAGIPDMYDYEYFPQKLMFGAVSPLVRCGNVVLAGCDDVLMATSYAFESESLKAVKNWFGEWKKELFVVGPLLPAGYGETKQSARGSKETQEFMERMLVEHGEKSVIFMSFGTIFWSTSPEYIEEVLEAFLDKNMPFIFAHASPFAKISQNLMEKVAQSGIGLLTDWCPQQYVLSHPATGWFLSHCGHNSIMESLACGIPLICWPFQADQPAAAAYLTEYLNVAFELIEVRTGEHGMKPLLRNGRAPKGTREAVGVEIRDVIDACRTFKGAELRKNAQALKVRLAEAWQGNGISRKEAQALLSKYSSR